jgi:hypothetical protein
MKAEPTTRPLAPKGVQLEKFGRRDGDVGGAMNAAESIAMKRPELTKSSAITCEICLPTFEGLPSSPVKSATATGIGAICPSVMSSRNVCEKAGTANNPQISIHADDKLNSLPIFCLSTSNTIPASPKVHSVNRLLSHIVNIT